MSQIMYVGAEKSLHKYFDGKNNNFSFDISDKKYSKLKVTSDALESAGLERLQESLEVRCQFNGLIAYL